MNVQSRVWSTRIATQLAALAIALLLWELLPRSGAVRSVFFPPLSSIIANFLTLLTDGSLPRETALTLWRSGAATVIGLLTGTLIGLAMEQFRPVRWLLNPVITLGYPTPKVAFIPIFVLWFGIESLSKILLAALAAFFPIAIATYNAAGGVRQSLRWSARSLGANTVRLYFSVLLPASLPGIMSGLQIAVPFAIIVVVVSEMTYSGGGLGTMLTMASRNFEVATQFSVLFTLMLIGIAVERALAMLRKYLLRWE